MADGMVFDFHTHTFVSDGALSPMELARRAMLNGYRAIGITDHTGIGSQERVLRELAEECRLVEQYWGIVALPGIELTYVPPEAINEAARRAKEFGARFVIVHGESPVEPTPPGTNRAALMSPYVDVLAHPGLLTRADALLAAERGGFIEISARRGHSLANGHVVKTARAVGARLIVDSDAHEPGDLLTPAFARTVALGAGLDETDLDEVLLHNPRALLARLGAALPPSAA